MFGIIKMVFNVLSTNIANAPNHTKCVSLSYQKRVIQPTLINLCPNEYSEELHHYPFAIELDRCVRRCTSLNVLSNKLCVPKKQKM